MSPNINQNQNSRFHFEKGRKSTDTQIKLCKRCAIEVSKEWSYHEDFLPLTQNSQNIFSPKYSKPWDRAWEGGLLGLKFAGYVPLASQYPYPTIVDSEAIL